MNFKRVSTAALALTMAAALAAPAFAAEGDAPTLLISPNPNAIAENFGGVVSLNGEEIGSVTYTYPIENSWEEREEIYSADELPGAPAGYIPMRLLCQADPRGSAYWESETKRAYFTLNSNQFIVDFKNNTVIVSDDEGETVAEGVEPYLAPMGVTYLPAEFLATLNKVTVESTVTDGVESFAITFVMQPLEKLANDIVEATEMGMVSETDMDTMVMAYEIDPENYAQLGAYFPITSIAPCTVIVAEVAEGKMDAAKADFEKVFQALKDQFSFYPMSIEMVEQGQIVESEDGKYLMLLISDNTDAGIQLFQDSVAAIEAEKQ